MSKAINVLDYATLTVGNAAVDLVSDASPAIPKACHGALITVEDDQVRFRTDGTAPTSSEGHLLEVGDALNWYSTENVNWYSVLFTVQFIRVTGDAKLKITYFD